MAKRLVVYMSPWCYSSQDTQRALNEWGVAADFVNIKEDRAAAALLRGWVGYESVPTIVLAEGEGREPFAPPAPLAPGSSPRGIDRDSLITEPTRTQLRAWLAKHNLIAE